MIIYILNVISTILVCFLAFFMAINLQKILFLEYHTKKQDRIIIIIMSVFCTVLAVCISILGLSKNTQRIFGLIILLTFCILGLFIYSAFIGRKRMKWLAFFEWIPMMGFLDGLFTLLLVIDNHFIGLEQIDLICLGIIYIFVWLISKLKPQLVENLKKDIEFRSLTVGEEIIVWACGIWLIISNEVLDDIISETATGFAYGYISVLNFLLVIITLIFVLASNYRDYYEKKSIKLQESLADAMDELEAQSLSTLMALTRAIEAKDRYTKGHSSRVAEYSKLIAARMGKSEEEQQNIYHIALLHDVGKIRVPEEVINKAGKLTDEEFEYIKLHPIAGYNILKGIHNDQQLAIGAKFHHERYDGKGYPNGLEGENIPEIARIIAVADSYDAMASNRSYRKALPQDVIKREIEKGMGTQFDPKIAKIMLQIIEEDKDYVLREQDKSEKVILVVDDTEFNLIIAEKILKMEECYTVLRASSGEEAIRIVSENTVDLIILDIEMPDMDGFETLEKIRKIVDVPVVFMTADKELSTITRASEMGVDDYVTKPFTKPRMLESVYGALYYKENE